MTRADFLRQMFADVTPGYHMHKAHWNTITIGGGVQDDELLRMITSSYDLIKPNWFDGKKKLPEVKNIILHECHAAARELDSNQVAQAAARACGQASACFHTLTHSLGLAFYGAAAIAYDRLGVDKAPEVYDQIAAEECAKMEAALRAVAVENEPNPAKINWLS